MPETLPRLLLITGDWPPPGRAVKRSAELLAAAGLRVEVFAFRGRNLFNYIAAWTDLRPRLHPKRYDVVHAQDASKALLAFPKRVPLVMTVVAGDRHIIQRWAAWFAAGRADAVVVASDEQRRSVRTRAPVHVIPADLEETARAALLADVYRSVIRS